MGAVVDDVGVNDAQGSASLYRSVPTATGILTENVRLLAAGGLAIDRFGSSVSLSGPIGLVGADRGDGPIVDQGLAYVFRGLDTATGTVTENAVLRASSGASLDLFGGAVSISGTLGVVGARNDGLGGVPSGVGSAYVFRNLDTVTGTVTEQATLVASGTVQQQSFGESVAVDGTVAVVGAPSGRRSAYVYRNLDTVTGTVTENVRLDSSLLIDETDSFGSSVDVHGTTVIVGAPGDDSSTGAAYVFRNVDTMSGSSASWSYKLLASDGADFDILGRSVALHGGTALVGAPQQGSTDRGAAYLYTGLATGSAVRSETVAIRASDPSTDAEFGTSVALDGDTFTIGAPAGNGAVAGSGNAYAGSVGSLTTFDPGSTSRAIDGVSFTSRTDWVVGATTDFNAVTLTAGDTANVTQPGTRVIIGRDAGSDFNTLTVEGTLTATEVVVGAAGNTSNQLAIGSSVAPGAVNAPITVAAGSVVNFTATTNSTHAGTISGAGSVAMFTSRTLTLTGASDYSGLTQIFFGTVNASNTALGSSAVQVFNGGTLTGTVSHSGTVAIVTGTLAGTGNYSGVVTVQTGGTLSPGTSAGLISLGAGSSLNGLAFLEIGGTTRGLTYDAVDVAGPLSVAGTLTIALINSHAPANGAVYDLFNASAITGAFSVINLPPLTGDLEWDTSLLYDTGVLSIVPEPSAAALLLGLAALGTGVWRRRRTG